MKTVQHSPEQQAVLAPLLALLDGLRRRDREAMLAQVMPDGGATIIRDGRVLHYSLRTLFEREFPPGEVDEQSTIRRYGSTTISRRFGRLTSFSSMVDCIIAAPTS